MQCLPVLIILLLDTKGINMRYSKTTGCFYPEDIFYKDLPDDIETVEQSEYDKAMARQPDERFEIISGKCVISKIPPVILTVEQQNAIVNQLRQAAYIAEADPLFMQYQRGEVTKEEWLASVAAIKERFPKVS